MNIENIKVGLNTYPVGLRNIYVNEKGNFNIETSDVLGNTSKGKINIEAMNDILIKPGDDITFYAHHRLGDNEPNKKKNKLNEVAIKIMSDTSVLGATSSADCPCKLAINAAELILSTKDKNVSPIQDYKDSKDVFDITVKNNTNGAGYLKVRAQAIDLRSETHGGIALQPKGFDGEGNMNKVKFEHGGGDGLEFFTDNALWFSAFNEEYRFNKYGIWKMATRDKVESNKYDASDESTHYKYVKQADDFYDKINNTDEVADTNSIIKTANAFNYGKDRHAKFTSRGNLEIATNVTYTFFPYTYEAENVISIPQVQTSTKFTESDLFEFLGDAANKEEGVKYTIEELIGLVFVTPDETKYSILRSPAPKIMIESGDNLELISSEKIKFSGILDFGSNFNFGETDGGIWYDYKITKKGATKDCSVIKINGINNSTSEISVDGIQIPANSTVELASASLYDVVKLVNYFKLEHLGPWTETTE